MRSLHLPALYLMEFNVIFQLNEAQKNDLMQLYKNEFWSHQRMRADVDKMLDHTNMIVGIESRQGKLIGFCRVLTDFVYRAVLFDVIIHPDYRGQGLGKLLIDTVVKHPDLQQVEHIDLCCLPEMIDFYKQWNFTTELGEFRLMRRLKY
jgi:ribosomal protein S18 acetylase RimI-like enzyme